MSARSHFPPWHHRLLRRLLRARRPHWRTALRRTDL